MTASPSIVICINRRLGLNSPSCAARGAETLAAELQRQLARAGLSVELKYIQCLGQCEQGPNLRIAPGEAFYQGVGLGDLPGIIVELQRLTQGQQRDQQKA
jgi:NADH:ubiquinone oxidoreductase subunit E